MNRLAFPACYAWLTTRFGRPDYISTNSLRECPRRRPCSGLLALLFFTALACGDVTATLIPRLVTLLPAVDTLEAIGESTRFTVQATDQNGTHLPVGAPFKFSSSSPAVARIDSLSGFVTAVSNGAVTISARAGSIVSSGLLIVAQAPALLRRLAGDGQSAAAGHALAVDPTVWVTDLLGHPVGGAPVDFSVATGSGSVSAANVLTDSAGRASVRWTLGTRALAPQRLRVRAGSVSVEFSANAETGPAAQLIKISGDDQSGEVGSTLPAPLVVRVTDAFGNPVPGHRVEFVVVEGEGSLAGGRSLAVQSDAAGIAQAVLSLGEGVGMNRVEVRSSGLSGSPTVFIARTMTPPPRWPTDLRMVSATPSTVSLAWTEVDDGTGRPARYQVRYAAGSLEWATGTVVMTGECGTPIVGSVIGATRYCTVTGLAPQTRYEFLVLAFRQDADGYVFSSRPSNEAVATTTAPPPPPPKPAVVTDLSASSPTESTVTLAWTEVDDGTGRPAQYQVRYAAASVDWPAGTPVMTGECGTPIVGWGIGATHRCTVTGLSPETRYEFQILAFRPVPGSYVFAERPSNVAGATTMAPAPSPPPPPPDGPSQPGVPATVRDLVTESATTTSVTLAWTEVNDGAGAPALYQIRYARNPIGWGWGSATVPEHGTCASPIRGSKIGGTLHCTVDGLTSATTYDFQLVAFREEPDRRIYSANLSNVATRRTEDAPPPPAPPPPPSQPSQPSDPRYPNQPAGFTVITDRAFNLTGEDGWSASSGNFLIVPDLTAPRSAPTVGRALFPAGFLGGIEPMWTEKWISDLGHTRLYVSFWVRVSENWQGHPVVSKVVYVWTHGKGVVTLDYLGANAAPLTSTARLQNLPGPALNLTANLANPEIKRGQWHRWEVLLVNNSGDNADGQVHWWIDGTKAGEYTNIRYSTSTQSKAWDNLAWRPVWGGGVGTVLQSMYMDFDHFYASGAAGGP